MKAQSPAGTWLRALHGQDEPQRGLAGGCGAGCAPGTAAAPWLPHACPTGAEPPHGTEQGGSALLPRWLLAGTWDGADGQRTDGQRGWHIPPHISCPWPSSREPALPHGSCPPPQLPSLWGRQPLRSPCLVPVALKEPWQRFLRCCWGRAPRAGLFLCLFLPSLGLWPRLRGRGSLWPQAGWGLKPAELLKAWTLSAVGLLRFSPACNLFELWQGSSSQMRIFFPPKEEKSTVSCGAAARGCPRLVWSSGAAFPSCPPCLLPGSAAGSLSRQLNQHQGRGRQVEGP